jgi:hypothetical protein
VNEVAMAHGWRLQVFVKINCSFVDVPIAPPSINRDYTECTTWNDRVVAQLRANPPDLAVVAMSHWVFNVNRADLSWEAQGRAMAREMSKLPASTRLVIVGDPPLPHLENVPACLSVYVSDYAHCSYPRVLYGANTGLRETLAAGMAGALYIDLTPDACPGTGRCQVVINNMIVWRDDHHFTATFARSLGPSLDARIVPFLVGSPGASPTP